MYTLTVFSIFTNEKQVIRLSHYAIINLLHMHGCELNMNRREARLKASQALYQIELIDTDIDAAIKSVTDEEEPSEFMLDLVYGTVENIHVLDPVIEKSLQGWTLDRMGLLDRTIVRMTLYEMNYIDDIPLKVTFNEGIELAKAFGGEESGRFVNGVLSKAIDQLEKKK